MTQSIQTVSSLLQGPEGYILVIGDSEQKQGKKAIPGLFPYIFSTVIDVVDICHNNNIDNLRSCKRKKKKKKSAWTAVIAIHIRASLES